MTKRAFVAALSVATISGCNCENPCNPAIPEEDQPIECFDAGPPAQPDFCDTREEGKTDTTNCVLPLACGLDGGRLAYINPPDDAGIIDSDFYSTTFGTLTARSLLHVQAGYVAPLTPVDLSVSVLQEKNGSTLSIARKVDDHGQGAPKLIDILVPFTESNAQLLLQVSDKGGRMPAVYDLRNPYFISVCTQENPDMNEPNDSPDAGATPIMLSPMGMTLHGTNTGYIATDDDIDRFQFTVPTDMPVTGRKIIYLHITTAMALMPPPPYRLSYTLYDPNDVPIAEGVTQNAFLQVDLSTAKLVRTPGTYTVVLKGYEQNPNDPAVVPGDLRQQYTVDVTILPDLDTEEPNDSMAEAAPRVMTLSPGNAVQKSGRISYTPDPEYFGFDIPSGSHATMSVKLTVGQSSGRFTPLAGPHDHQLRVMSAVAGAGVPDSINNCLNDNAACPKGYDPNDLVQRDLVTRICTGFADAGSAQCLWLERNANLDSNFFKDLHNLQGVIPVPPRSATTRYWVVVGDDGNNWADDVPWTLDVSLANDPDEARFPGGGALASTLNGTVNGQLTFGYGRVLEDWDLGKCARNPNGDMGNENNCHGVRSPFDYDAVPSDIDTFSFNLGLGSDQSWGLQWEIDKVDGGSLPAELAIDLSFCGQVLADGGCGLRTTTAYQSGTFSPWYSNADPDRVVGWSRVDMGSFVRIKAEANQCLCFQSAFTKFNMSLLVADRNYYGPLTYRVTQTTGAYTGLFPGDGGVAMPSPCGKFPPDGGTTPPVCGLP